MTEMITTKTHTGPLPDPIQVLEKHFKHGGTSIIHAAFENTFFADPAARCGRGHPTTRIEPA